MIIYIRHGDDSDSDPTYAHDPRLTINGRREAKKKAFSLVKRYGSPLLILCSPFRRTIQTAKMMKKMCGSKTEIFIDPNLSRYFCTREKCDPDMHYGTESYNAPIYERWSGFENRINKHINMIEKKRFRYDNSATVWCITHALVYKHVARTYQVNIPSYIPFMHHFTLRSRQMPLPKEKRGKKKCKRRK
jgi:broad specificity phosphatase PhoE